MNKRNKARIRFYALVFFALCIVLGNVWLSISHTEQFVTASVILEENHEN